MDGYGNSVKTYSIYSISMGWRLLGDRLGFASHTRRLGSWLGLVDDSWGFVKGLDGVD
jgi:hypothetical protein